MLVSISQRSTAVVAIEILSAESEVRVNKPNIIAREPQRLALQRRGGRLLDHHNDAVFTRRNVRRELHHELAVVAHLGRCLDRSHDLPSSNGHALTYGSTYGPLGITATFAAGPYSAR